MPAVLGEAAWFRLCWQASHGLQLPSLWIIPTAAVSYYYNTCSDLLVELEPLQLDRLDLDLDQLQRAHLFYSQLQ